MSRVDSYGYKIYDEIKNKAKYPDNEQYCENRYTAEVPRGSCPMFENLNKTSILSDYWIRHLFDIRTYRLYTEL